MREPTGPGLRRVESREQELAVAQEQWWAQSLAGAMASSSFSLSTRSLGLGMTG